MVNDLQRPAILSIVPAPLDPAPDRHARKDW